MGFFHCVQKVFQFYAFILPEPLTENSVLKDRTYSSSSEILNTKNNSYSLKISCSSVT